ncbi:hypothetical protein GYMLUDRAFT_671481 [Collybiopsis luxurians FD-317 M1]|uniref:F-box domain-containing protein n=1 Tax=Collybiopsis luxurians FD-317 M1 TaxID=944289 RepID=A0A0D0CAU3_9AGAR|nr:hypothetical protein GYMLUDRAFT_671481 [Collybiopsis luxurians FD-317 M1]
MPSELIRSGPLNRSVRRFTKRILRKTIKKYYCSFPNEIFALIFGHLVDDLPSLKNISLVCRDFAAMARPFVFRDIRRPYKRYLIATTDSLVKRFWRFIRAHPNMTDFVRTLQFSAYAMSWRDLGRLDFILAHLQLLQEICMDHPKIRHLQAIERFFSNTLKELHCLDVVLDTPAHFEAFQNMPNSLIALEVLVLNVAIYEDAERPLIFPCTLNFMSLKRTDMILLSCVKLGLAVSSNLPKLRVLLLEFISWDGDWSRWLEENSDRQSNWSPLSISGTLVVFNADTFYLDKPHSKRK